PDVEYRRQAPSAASTKSRGMMGVRVGINGFGRIGRNILRACLASGSDLDFVAVNDITDSETLAHLLKYDSVHCTLREPVRADGATLRIGEKLLRVLTERGPANLPWKDL